MIFLKNIFGEWHYHTWKFSISKHKLILKEDIFILDFKEYPQVNCKVNKQWTESNKIHIQQPLWWEQEPTGTDAQRFQMPAWPDPDLNKYACYAHPMKVKLENTFKEQETIKSDLGRDVNQSYL